MCFKTPKPPKPPPLPMPPNPSEATQRAEDQEMRRKNAISMSRSSTVATSPTGDAGYGANVQRTRLGV